MFHQILKVEKNIKMDHHFITCVYLPVTSVPIKMILIIQIVLRILVTVNFDRRKALDKNVSDMSLAEHFCLKFFQNYELQNISTVPR